MAVQNNKDTLSISHNGKLRVEGVEVLMDIERQSIGMVFVEDDGTKERREIESGK